MTATVQPAPSTLAPAALAARFQELTEQWQSETWMLSNADNIARHPAYQEIIRLGQPVVPLILAEMQTRPGHWFWALNVINQCDPVQAEHAGDIQAMTQDWLTWAKANHRV